MQTSNYTLEDYDLNIFKYEMEVPDESLEDSSQGTTWVHAGPWYIHVYTVSEEGHDELGEPIQLTESEGRVLIDNDPYFQDQEPDLWYGLAGFVRDKDAILSGRLRKIFNGLPKYKEEVLF